MTFREALKILIDRRHRAIDGEPCRWDFAGSFAYGPDYYDNLTEFEAIAIAEKYLRDDPDARRDEGPPSGP